MAGIRLISQLSEEEWQRAKAKRAEEEARYERYMKEREQEEKDYEKRVKENRRFIKREQKLEREKQLLKEQRRKQREERAARRSTPEYKARQEKRAGRAMPDACEICGEVHPLVFDHCHAKGHFRGWICNACNSALGMARDSEVILRKMADYLERNR